MTATAASATAVAAPRGAARPWSEPVACEEPSGAAATPGPRLGATAATVGICSAPRPPFGLVDASDSVAELSADVTVCRARTRTGSSVAPPARASSDRGPVSAVTPLGRASAGTRSPAVPAVSGCDDCPFPASAFGLEITGGSTPSVDPPTSAGVSVSPGSSAESAGSPVVVSPSVAVPASPTPSAGASPGTSGSSPPTWPSSVGAAAPDAGSPTSPSEAEEDGFAAPVGSGSSADTPPPTGSPGAVTGRPTPSVPEVGTASAPAGASELAAPGAGTVGRNASGSTYPSGADARRTPRWTYGSATSGSPEGPTVPTWAPSSTESPSATAVSPRWTSVTA